MTAPGEKLEVGTKVRVGARARIFVGSIGTVLIVEPTSDRHPTVMVKIDDPPDVQVWFYEDELEIDAEPGT